MTEYRNADIATILDAIEDQCRPSFDHMPDMQHDLLVGYLAQIRLAITLPAFPSMSHNDWERQQLIASNGYWIEDVKPTFRDDPTYREARYTAHEVPCPLCSAAPDDMCVTASGRTTTKPHQGRIYARMNVLTGYDGIEALVEPLDCTICDPESPDACNPHGIMRKALVDPWGVDEMLDAEDRRVFAARQQVLDAAERVRQERLAQAMLATLAASSADEIIKF